MRRLRETFTIAAFVAFWGEGNKSLPEPLEKQKNAPELKGVKSEGKIAGRGCTQMKF